MSRTQLIRRILAGSALAAVVTAGFAAPASAELSKEQLSSLNPKWTKYKDCPKDGPCYVLDTRFISAKMTNASESGACTVISSRGDENYVLPIFAIIDGMGVNSNRLATAEDQEFRVNVAKRTWEGSGRGSNLGKQWYDRMTTAGVTLANQDRSKAAYKHLQWRDYVTPINHTSFSNDGMIMTMNFMEHDNAKTADLDRLYYQSAKDLKDSLVETSDANAVRSTLAQSPDYDADATKQSLLYVAKIAPKVAEVIVAAETGGASAALTAGATDLGTTIGLFEGLYNSLAMYDTDDVGEQKTVFVKFKDLPLGKEVKFTMGGKTDPKACDTGSFEVTVGVKLSKVKDNPAYKPAAAAAKPAGFTFANGGNPTWTSQPTAGKPYSFVPGSFAINGADSQTALGLKALTRAYYCTTREKTSNPVANRCAPGREGASQTPAGSGNFILGGGAAATSPDPVPAQHAGKWAVLGTSLVQNNKLLSIVYSAPQQVARAAAAAPSAAASATAAAPASGKLAVTVSAPPRFDGALTVGGKFPITQGTFSAANGTNASETVMVVSGVYYCPAANSPLSACVNGGVINQTTGTAVANGATVSVGGSGGTAGTVSAAQAGKFAILVSNAVNKTTQEILATTQSAAQQIGGAAAAAPSQATTFVAAAPTPGDCPRISGSQATATSCPTMTVVGGGNAKASSKIQVTAGTYDTAGQRATRQVFLYSCTAQDRATCTNIGSGTNVETSGSFTFDLATLGGASLVGKYLHAESFVQNPSTFVGLGTFNATPRFIGVNP